MRYRRNVLFVNIPPPFMGADTHLRIYYYKTATGSGIVYQGNLKAIIIRSEED
jgi:hypothetical protein